MPILKDWKTDFTIFILPLFVGAFYALQFTNYGDVFTHVLPLILIYILIDIGHLGLTAAVLFKDKDLRQKKRLELFVAPIIFLSVFFGMTAVRPDLALHLIAIYAFWHIVKQHLAWLTRSYRKQKVPIPRNQQIFDQIVFWALTIIPFAVLCTGSLGVLPSYYRTDDLLLFPSLSKLPNPWPVLSLIAFAYLIYLGFLRPIPWGRIIYFVSIYLWTVGGLLIFKSHAFFFAYLVLTHGLSYADFIYNGWSSPEKENRLRFKEKAVIFVSTSFFAFAWFIGLSILEKNPSPMIAALCFLPLITHHALDSVLWRRTS